MLRNAHFYFDAAALNVMRNSTLRGVTNYCKPSKGPFVVGILGDAKNDDVVLCLLE